MAADIVSTKGDNRAQRWVSTEVLWKWVDANGKALGIGRPYLGRDPRMSARSMVRNTSRAEARRTARKPTSSREKRGPWQRKAAEGEGTGDARAEGPREAAEISAISHEARDLSLTAYRRGVGNGTSRISAVPASCVRTSTA